MQVLILRVRRVTVKSVLKISIIVRFNYPISLYSKKIVDFVPISEFIFFLSACA